jgi:hypothetical protein
MNSRNEQQKGEIMRKITIVGAGQSGLQLGFSLLAKGYEVTILSDRSPEQIRTGSVMSTQCMFDSALEVERELGLNLWDAESPAVEGIAVRIAGEGSTPALEWSARLDKPGQSIDQRLKIPVWMKLFEERGGRLIITKAGLNDLDDAAATSDLVIISAGKGDIAGIFERDADKSPFDRPQRSLSLCSVRNLERHHEFTAVCFNIIPGVGEYFVVPGLTEYGANDYMLFEAIPGGPMDVFHEANSPQEQLELSKAVLQKFLPWEAERSRKAELTDNGGTLRGRFAPTVRKPVAHLPSGAIVLGMADVVVLNDPLTGQGSNNAAKCAQIYANQIIAHGSRPFDAEWMQATFDAYWDYAQWVTGWTNAMLLPPPPHVLKILGAASQSPAVASRFVNAFNNPPDFFPWLADPVEADRMLAYA